ncbi:hypothetical protein BGW37DRAFT_225768 [Umbelopsis sp. PMI_123]|nr:hypothetical protein BGW37DRAFT_225768 [Umbelopsis sp. PMI_123]
MSLMPLFTLFSLFFFLSFSLSITSVFHAPLVPIVIQYVKVPYTDILIIKFYLCFKLIQIHSKSNFTVVRVKKSLFLI